MGFISFAGRVLFASVLILSAWQECKSLGISTLDLHKLLLLVVDSLGCIKFVWFNEFGVDGGPAAKNMRPKFELFTNHVTSYLGVRVPETEIKHFVAAAIALKGIGGILFIFGSSFGAYLLLMYLGVATPILYDFYNYDSEKPEFHQLFVKFTQNLALFGALLFFMGMKNSIPKRQHKKKVPKAKMI